MFGLIISSRPLLTPPQTISATQYAFTLPSTPPFSHIVLFLLPNTTLPPGTAAAVYIQLPSTPGEFQFLGAIANEKPSAIFKINNKALNNNNVGDIDAMTDDPGAAAGAGGDITLGISIEPVEQVAQSLKTLKLQQQSSQQSQSQTSQPIPPKLLAQRIIKNAYDFLASFGSDVVPLKAFQSWWDKFEKKIENDPWFLERSDGG